MAKKYGLQLRVLPSQKKKKPLRPPLPKPAGFGDDDDDVEKELCRQPSKNKSLRHIEQQHKKALEEDPSVLDYDGVYDAMKDQAVRTRAQDRQDRRARILIALAAPIHRRTVVAIITSYFCPTVCLNHPDHRSHCIDQRVDVLTTNDDSPSTTVGSPQIRNFVPYLFSSSALNCLNHRVFYYKCQLRHR